MTKFFFKFKKTDFWPIFGPFSQNHAKILRKLIRLVDETCAIVLMQAGMQANQFASAIDRGGNIRNFTDDRAGKSFFFWRLKSDLSLNFCVCHKESKIMN